jgi:hypothetical protein
MNKWGMLITDWLPAVLSGVVAVEIVMKDAPGETKAQIVLGAITAGAEVGQAVPQPDVQSISRLISGVVGALNQQGVFSHKGN